MLRLARTEQRSGRRSRSSVETLWSGRIEEPIRTLAAAAVVLVCFGIGACSGGESTPSNVAADAGSGSDGGTPIEAADAGSERDSGGDAASDGGTNLGLPVGAKAVEAWLAAGEYRTWTCEPIAHPARSPSSHGFSRICSNEAIASNGAGTDDWPKGAAAVAELFDDAMGTTPVGYAYYLKTDADSAGGSNWYWYERVPPSSSVPHDAQGVVADGLGTGGSAQTICVGCHAAAGSDLSYSPSPGSRDFVYTPAR